MALLCGKEFERMSKRREDDEQLIADLARTKSPILQSDAFNSLAELNEQCLTLFAEQAQLAGTHGNQGNPIFREFLAIWRTLDADARRRAAACPYLLLDAGFSDLNRWRPAHPNQIYEPKKAPYLTFFTVDRTISVARQVLMYAWHLVRSKNVAAQSLLGMLPQCTKVLGTCSITEIDKLAERHAAWLRPRWPHRVYQWRDLLYAAASGEPDALENARMHGLQLLASECRIAKLTLKQNTLFGGY
jgi:hypothetical protein